jgi:hypothetical protein
MIDWLNNRQKAIDEAKRDSSFTNVNVFHYTGESGPDARNSDPSRNQRVINRVVPAVPQLDCLSWSAYDGMDLGVAELRATLDYLMSMLPTNKAAAVRTARLGWRIRVGAETPDKQEPLTRSFCVRCCRGAALRSVLANLQQRAGAAFLPDQPAKPEGRIVAPAPSFYKRSAVVCCGVPSTAWTLPQPAEFGQAMVPILERPLEAPIAIVVTNSAAAWISDSELEVAGTVARAIYGDECATVRVFWGSRDGGSSGTLGPQPRSRTEHQLWADEAYYSAHQRLWLGSLVQFPRSNAMAEVWATESMQANRVFNFQSAKTSGEINGPSHMRA